MRKNFNPEAIASKMKVHLEGLNQKDIKEVLKNLDTFLEYELILQKLN